MLENKINELIKALNENTQALQHTQDKPLPKKAVIAKPKDKPLPKKTVIVEPKAPEPPKEKEAVIVEPKAPEKQWASYDPEPVEIPEIVINQKETPEPVETPEEEIIDTAHLFIKAVKKHTEYGDIVVHKLNDYGVKSVADIPKDKYSDYNDFLDGLSSEEK